MSDDMSIQELHEALQKESARSSELSLRLQTTLYWNDRLTNTLAKICEAFLAGDTQTVLADIGQIATAYKRNTQTIGSVH